MRGSSGFTPHLVTGVWIGFDQPATIIANGYAGDLAVPVWASFMKVATKADKPDWFDRPANVVGVNVCRVSGKLPNGGCDHVEVVNRDGLIETRSMIYTDYFVKGKAADRACVRSIRRRHSWTGSRACLGPANRASRCARMMPAFRLRQTGTAGAHPAPPPPAVHADERRDDPKADTAQKKRGFWARVFGKDGKKRIRTIKKIQKPEKEEGCDRRLVMPFRDITGHRASARPDRACHAPGHAAAQPDLCRAGGRREADGGGRAGADDELHWRSSRLAANDACGECAACKRIARGVHADVLLLEPGETGAIKIDQVRDAIERAAYRPFEGRRRVVIVDDAECAERRSAERAAENAGRAAGGLDVHPGDCAARTCCCRRCCRDASGCGSAAWRRRKWLVS